MPIYLRLFSCLFLSLGLVLSSSSPKAESALKATYSAPLAQHWVLRTLDGEAVPDSLQVEDATAHLLRSTDSSVHQQVPGRSYIGVFTHTFASRLLALTKVITTLMRCDDSTMNVELRYLTALEQSTHYKIDGSTLSLFDKEGSTPRATFVAIQ